MALNLTNRMTSEEEKKTTHTHTYTFQLIFRRIDFDFAADQIISN